MIICVCNNINDKDVAQALQMGASHYEEVIDCCGGEPCCLTCKAEVQDLINHHKETDHEQQNHYR